VDAGRAANAVRDITDGYELLPRPDHPLLIDGPDYLAGRVGSLIAVFVARSAEEHSYARLTSRFVLARLAYPAHTQWVLVVDEGTRWLSRARLDFHQTYLLDGDSARPAFRANLAPVTTGSASAIWERAAVLQSVSMQAWGRLDHVATISDALEVERSLEASNYPSYEVQDHGHRCPYWRPRGLRAVQGGRFGLVPGRARRHDLEPFLRWSAQRTLAVDNGVPYLIDDTVGILAMREPRRQLATSIRAAALAGWALVPMASEAVRVAANDLADRGVRWPG
jgi:hypothetical protein